ncbi:Calcium-dependent protein kinase 3 (PfCDPK3) [Durusdinium trenchii]|uniref:Calcium-dependent protein kinase 3 (PfCDPK3) n=1 Tax=Durusdinium trenchii TaxID=1381693 RepID=A0ABP0MVS2_9DINO
MGQSCQSCQTGAHRFPEQGAPKPSVPVRPRFENEPWVAFHCNAFQISSSTTAPRAGTKQDEMQGWTKVYSLGRLLGDGISAKVFEAEALADLETTETAQQMPFSTCGAVTASIPQCLREHGRKVAIKRFHRLGSRTFNKELTALKRVGTHPNVLRLLESYQGFNREDVLVLEYCDGSTLYDLYAREHPKGGLPERLVARLLRQLFLALQHLSSCGVEHQDVKPENMMLFDVAVSAFQAELKLGDFGWAAIAAPEGKATKPPPTGAGSLWYAPPELNPPVEGIEPEPLAVDQHGEPIKGLSDMWSAGVVLYLLLVGHNPFNQALKQQTQEAQDQEVLRLVAHGRYNARTERWQGLHPDARDLVEKLLKVTPSQRLPPSDALQHSFVTKRTVSGRVSGYGGNSSAISTCMDGEHSVFFHGSVAPWAGRERRWQRLDGFQRLAWLAMARALAEPELDRAVVQGATSCLVG